MDHSQNSDSLCCFKGLQISSYYLQGKVPLLIQSITPAIQRKNNPILSTGEIVMNLVPQMLQGIVNQFKGLESNVNLMNYISCLNSLLKGTITQVKK
jgi:hypothetical protein